MDPIFYGVSEEIRTPGPRLRRALLYPAELNTHNGAGSGNRTHLSSLEGWSITDIRYPHIWSERRDSNPQHPPWQGGALPLSHFRTIGADEGSRTPTPKALDPKSSASASSATLAYKILYHNKNIYGNCLCNQKAVLLTKNGLKSVVIHPRLELGTP